MEKEKKLSSSPYKVESFLAGRGYVKSGRTQNFGASGEVVADFYVYIKGNFEIILNVTEGVVGINYSGKQIMGFNKSMIEHIDCFKAYMVEMETILVNG